MKNRYRIEVKTNVIIGSNLKEESSLTDAITEYGKLIKLYTMNNQGCEILLYDKFGCKKHGVYKLIGCCSI